MQEATENAPETDSRRDLSASFDAATARKAELSKRVLHDQERILLARGVEAITMDKLH